MKLFWFLGHFGLAHTDYSPGESTDGYQIAEPISIVSRGVQILIHLQMPCIRTKMDQN